MGARHRLIVRTSDGQYLADVNRWETVQYGRFLNNPGWFMVVCPPDELSGLLRADHLVEFWREPEGGDDQLEMVGFLRYWDYFEQAPGDDRLRIGGPDQIELIQRGIVGYASGTAGASKTDFADDMIKEIMDENKGPGASNSPEGRFRGFPTDHFDIAGSSSLAPSMTKEFAWRNLYDVIAELAEASEDRGTPLYFDCVPVGAGRFQFRTFVNVRGVDRTVTSGLRPLIFSREAGNLADPFLREDWRDEINYVWGGGQGEGSARVIDTENDLPRIYFSIWNRREAFQDAREMSTTLGVATRAFERMQEGRPRLIFRGKLLDAPQTRYGVDWYFGDRVTVRYRGKEFDSDIRSVEVTVNSNGLETITARLEAEVAFS